MMRRIAAVRSIQVLQYSDGENEWSKIATTKKMQSFTIPQKVRRISSHNNWSGYALNVQQMSDTGG